MADDLTTDEQRRRSAGQRRINVLWEVTQSIIALSVTGTTLYVLAVLALKDFRPAELSNAFFLVIGFYFGRTNHARQGGIGGSAERESR